MDEQRHRFLWSTNWRRSSRCPECGHKQGDINLDMQPLALSDTIATLKEQAMASLEQTRTAELAPSWSE